MTAYRLSSDEHADLLCSFSRVRTALAAKRQSLTEAGALNSEDGLELMRDEAHLDAVKEQIAHLASGNATRADERRFTELVMVKAAEWASRTKALHEERAHLEGIIAFNELGMDGELVIVN